MRRAGRCSGAGTGAGSRSGSLRRGLWTGLRYLPGVELETFLKRFPAVSREWVEARVRRQVSLGNLCFSADGTVLQIAPGRWFWHDTVGADLLG